jgi:hypothetical protein
VRACDKAKTEASDEPGAGAGWFWLCAASIGLYSAIVPAILVTSKA